MSIATIEVSVSALLHNVAYLKKISPNSQIMAIVKANAYSHGKDKIAMLLDDKVDYFGVARLDEGIKLRKAGVRSPIILLEGFFRQDNLQSIIEYNLQTVIHSFEQIACLNQLSSDSELTVWFKFDSGMHRLGFRADESKKAFSQLASHPSVARPINVMSHFSCADELDSPETSNQLEIFESFIDSVDDPTLIGKKSIAASAGILAWPQSQFDIIRPGIALYGVSPFSYSQPNKSTGKQLGLKPVMKFKSELIAIRSHKKGEKVGYGQIWESPKETKLGVVAMGYGDGYPRDIIADTPVWINGRLLPIVGRVAMDMILVDLGLDSQEKIGEEVIFWGNDDLPVEFIAAHSQMSPYELLTRLTERAELVYVD